LFSSHFTSCCFSCSHHSFNFILISLFFVSLSQCSSVKFHLYSPIFWIYINNPVWFSYF
jgi:hypothetical protein